MTNLKKTQMALLPKTKKKKKKKKKKSVASSPGLEKH
jgi:hypothetical protein